MTIGRKLIVGYGALIAMSAMVVAMSVVTDRRIRRDVVDLSAHAQAEVLAAHRFGNALAVVEGRLRDLARARERATHGPPQESHIPAARAALDDALIALRDALLQAPHPSVARAAQSARSATGEHDELQVLAELQAATVRLEKRARTLDSSVETRSPAEVERAVDALLADISGGITPQLQLVMQDAEAEMRSASAAFAPTLLAARRIEMAAVMAAALLALLIGSALTSSLSERDRAQSTLQDFNVTLERTVQERTAQLQQVVDVAPFGAAVYQLHPDDRLVFVSANRSADRILNVDTRQFIGKTIEEAFPAIANTSLPERCRSAVRDRITQHVGPIAYNENGINGTFDLHLIPLGSDRMAVFFRDITELVHAYDETLAGWSRAMDVRDRETEGHTRRVTEMTIALARALGVSESDLVHIRWGSLLHDIGKIGVPDNILLKPGPLTEEEWVIMRRHPEIARDMLSPIAFLKRALAIPYCHHERWDGSGYPRGLAGDQIPLAARIFAVADVWDALRSHRPYHRAWPAEEALSYIRTHAGRQFDPAVVEAMERIIAEDIASGRGVRLQADLRAG